MQYQLKMSAEEVSQYVREVFPQSIGYGWEVVDLCPGTIVVGYGISDQDLRPGGTVSGPTMFALADVAAYLLILGHIGRVALAVTTNLNINFLAKPQMGDLEARGKLLKLGRRLAVCDIAIHSRVDQVLVAHATATYSIPPES